MINLKVLIASLLATTTMLTFNSLGAKAEWRQDSVGYWYSQENSYAINWKQIDGVWYYFDTNGYMKKNWILDKGNWYYLDSNGAMQTGIIQVNGKTYYLAESGEVKTGKVTIAGEKYNFAMSGDAIGDKIPQADKAFTGEGIAITPVKINNALISNGKTIEIKLDGNPTTGYEWQYHIDVNGVINEDSSQYKQHNTNTDLVGVGGTYTWTFSALKEGTAKITFEYLRPWEKEATKTKTYIFTIDKDLKITAKELN